MGVAGGTGNADGNEHLHLEVRVGNAGALNNNSIYDATTDTAWQSLTLVDPNLAWNLPIAPWYDVEN